MNRATEISKQKRYVKYSNFTDYNNLCIRCDERWKAGEHDHIAITMCKPCTKEYKDKKQPTKRQLLEAQCNEAIAGVYQRERI